MGETLVYESPTGAKVKKDLEKDHCGNCLRYNEKMKLLYFDIILHCFNFTIECVKDTKFPVRGALIHGSALRNVYWKRKVVIIPMNVNTQPKIPLNILKMS